MANQYCYDIIPKLKLGTSQEDEIIKNSIKEYIKNIYLKSKHTTVFKDLEKIPFVIAYSDKNNTFCVTMTSQAKKYKEAIDVIHDKIKENEINIGKTKVKLSKPYIFGAEKQKWWEEKEELCDIKGINRWNTLEHNGPYFTHIMEPYEKLGASLIYDGVKYKLNEEEEKVAGFYAKRIISEENPDITIYHTKDKVFNNNFFTDFKKYLTVEHKKIFKSFDKIDFSDLIDKIKIKKEKDKSSDKILKKEKIEEKKLNYGFAILDGKREKVGNFVIEPAGIFMGRGQHPNRGKIKSEIYPNDVTINIGEKDKVPIPPKGYKWNNIVHDHNAEWINKWTDPISGDIKYTRFSHEGRFKGECDIIKYDKARKLNANIDIVKERYMEDAENGNTIAIKQLGTVLFLIDEYGLRVGGEKSEEEADTVGASTLKVGNIKIKQNENIIILDFLGKDSIHFYKELEVPDIIYKNFKNFIKGKNNDSEIFDKISASTINDYLKSFDKGFTAKVFRTRLASSIINEELKSVKVPKDSTKKEVKFLFNKANKSVAVVLNHVRTVSKKKLESIEKLNDKLKQLKQELKDEGKGPKAGKIKEKIEKLKMDIESKSDTSEVAITTSLTNYIDPRIVISWCKKNNITSDYIYTSTLLKKFNWADEITDKKWDYINSKNVLGTELDPEDISESQKVTKSESKKVKTPRKVISPTELIAPTESKKVITPEKIVEIIDYSEKAILIKGKFSQEIKEILKTNYKLLWNNTLNGWISSKKYKDSIIETLKDNQISFIESGKSKLKSDDDITIEDYSDKSILIKGKISENIKQTLKDNNLIVWNGSLQGWIGKKSNKQEIIEILSGINKSLELKNKFTEEICNNLIKKNNINILDTLPIEIQSIIKIMSLKYIKKMKNPPKIIKLIYNKYYK